MTSVEQTFQLKQAEVQKELQEKWKECSPIPSADIPSDTSFEQTFQLKQAEVQKELQEKWRECCLFPPVIPSADILSDDFVTEGFCLRPSFSMGTNFYGHTLSGSIWKTTWSLFYVSQSKALSDGASAEYCETLKFRISWIASQHREELLDEKLDVEFPALKGAKGAQARRGFLVLVKEIGEIAQKWVNLKHTADGDPLVQSLFCLTADIFQSLFHPFVKTKQVAFWMQGEKCDGEENLLWSSTDKVFQMKCYAGVLFMGDSSFMQSLGRQAPYSLLRDKKEQTLSKTNNRVIALESDETIKNRDWCALFLTKGVQKCFFSLTSWYPFLYRSERKENLLGCQLHLRVIGVKKILKRTWKKDIWIDVSNCRAMLKPLPTKKPQKKFSFRHALLSKIYYQLCLHYGKNLFSVENTPAVHSLCTGFSIEGKNLSPFLEAAQKTVPSCKEHDHFNASIFNFVRETNSVREFNQKGINLFFAKATKQDSESFGYPLPLHTISLLCEQRVAVIESTSTEKENSSIETPPLQKKRPVSYADGSAKNR